MIQIIARNCVFFASVLVWNISCTSASDDAGIDCADPDAECTLAETASQAGFWIGAAVTSDNLSLAAEHFNSIMPEYGMGWGRLAIQVGRYDFTYMDSLIGRAIEENMRVQGFLLWGKYPGGGFPEDLEELVFTDPNPAARMEELIAEHITTVMGRYGEAVESWRVMNEPLEMAGAGFEENLFYRAMGARYVAEAFHMAHAEDPDARLLLNEYLLSYDDSKAVALYDLVASLLDEGVPIDFVGIQTHSFFTRPDRELFEQYLQSFVDLGILVELTELDATKYSLRDQVDGGMDLFEAQAELYGWLTSTCIAMTSCTGVSFWGVDDRRSWLDEKFPFDADAPNLPMLLDTDLQPKPAYRAVQDAIAVRIADDTPSF